MAMVIYNNMLATKSLGALNKNIVEKGKRMTRLATGEKINSAGDSAAEFSISERMQVQLRGLGQDIENTKTGRSMLGVAAGGMESIVEELRSMKEMAINAANDTNTDADRATLQKEFDQRKQDIADIVSSTNYNGKLLLDGTYARKHLKVDTNTVTEEVDSELGARGAQGAVTRAFTGTERTWPTDSQVVDGVTTVTLSEAGAYTIPDGFTGTIQVSSAAAAAGVKLSQAGSNLSNVNINVENGGSGANLWIDGLNITNSADASLIQFTGSGNTLTLLGSNTLNLTGNNTMAAVVDMGDSMTLQGNGSALNITRSGSGACIGTDSGEVASGDLYVVDANLNLDEGDDGNGATIGTGSASTIMGNITVENSTVTMRGGTFSGIGSGYDGAKCGDITVRQSTIIDTYSIDTCIGSGYYNCTCGNILVESCIVNATNSDSAIIGAGDENGHCGTITVSNTDIESTSEHGAAVGSGRRAHAGDVYIKNATKIKHVSTNGAAIGSGQNGSVGTIHISASSLRLLDASEAYIAPDHVIPGVGHGNGGSAADTSGLTGMADDGEVVEEEEKYVDGTPLIVHTGTKANQQMRCYIENLGLEALGIADAELTTQAKATHLLGNPHNPAVEGVLDKAINYVLGEATQVGAYMSRLEKTRDNLTTNQENTNSAESTIRDADMAKEMTEYTKANVLTQAAQSMLAQANQNSSSVLSLLQ